MSPPASIIWKSFWLQIQIQALLMFHVKTCELLGQDIWISMICVFAVHEMNKNTKYQRLQSCWWCCNYCSVFSLFKLFLWTADLTMKKTQIWFKSIVDHSDSITMINESILVVSVICIIFIFLKSSSVWESMGISCFSCLKKCLYFSHSSNSVSNI